MSSSHKPFDRVSLPCTTSSSYNGLVPDSKQIVYCLEFRVLIWPSLPHSFFSFVVALAVIASRIITVLNERLSTLWVKINAKRSLEIAVIFAGLSKSVSTVVLAIWFRVVFDCCVACTAIQLVRGGSSTVLCSLKMVARCYFGLCLSFSSLPGRRRQRFGRIRVDFENKTEQWQSLRITISSNLLCSISLKTTVLLTFQKEIWWLELLLEHWFYDWFRMAHNVFRWRTSSSQLPVVANRIFIFIPATRLALLYLYCVMY